MKKIVILSGKGGTGKTTIAAALIKLMNVNAYADCDVDAPNLHILCEGDTDTIDKHDFIGSKKAVIDEKLCIKCGRCQSICRFGAISKYNGAYKVNGMLCEGCGVCTLVCKDNLIELVNDVSGHTYLYKGINTFSTARLKMGRGNSGKLVYQVKKNLYDNSKSDLAIIDGSPGIGCPVISTLNGADIAIIVTEPSKSGFSDLKRILSTAQNAEVKTLVCINKYDVNIRMTNCIEEFCIENNIAVIGKIPYDDMVLKSLSEGKSVIEYDSKSKKEIYNMYYILENILKEGEKTAN